MTRAAWAERKVEKICAQPLHLGHGEWPVGQCEAVRLLLAEHRRAVRVVTAEIKRVKLDRHNYSVVTRAEMTKCLDRLLAALQKGRT